ncbi:putative DNA-binding protein [Alkalicoccus chagannorensis]|uniref:putative DNA-binding protein n=1 Tax=Alkalicoccus chagannorensis TaxID=427072 RepID=UPI0003F8B572|nr:putative DNA-binding protein [Alkalicoccus chagannorensis]
MIEKTLRMNYLYDFYYALLTEKQNQYMSMYYLDDWSLGEIADYFEISRQAVYDNIRRTELLLEEYEAKLGLLEKYEGRKKQISRLNELIQQGDHPKLQEIIQELENLE